MIKCPLCQWNNAESTQHCQSCGCDLESARKLEHDKDNPDCYSYTPPRRILEKGVGTLGSGVDVVFKFGMSKFTIPMIICKVFLLALLQYVTMMLYLENNSLFYVLIPVSLALMIEIMGWMIFTRGCRKKKRKFVSLGLRALYAFHSIATAYCVLVLLLTVYLSMSVALSFGQSNSIVSFMDGVSPIIAVSILSGINAIIVAIVLFLVMCTKFLQVMLDVFNRNVLDYYRCTGVLPLVFIVMGILCSACTVILMSYKEYAMEIISRYDILYKYLYAFISDHYLFISVISVTLALVTLLSGFMVLGYRRTYRKMFVSKTKVKKM